MAVYSYSRTSEIENLESDIPLERQLEVERQNILSFIQETGQYVEAHYDDKQIKWTQDFIKRAEAKALLRRLQAGDAVIVNSLERIFSHSEDVVNTLAVFQKRGVKLLVVELGGDITAPDFMFSFSQAASLFNKIEKRRSTERIKSVKANQRKKGRFLGGSRPFGYMIHENGRLIENPMEQRVLKKIMEMKSQGKSLRAISSAVSTPMMPVSFKTVQRLIKRNEDYSASGSDA